MVYVDEHCHWTAERCHLVADSPEELARFHASLHRAAFGLTEQSVCLQYPGTRDEHYDITQDERNVAIGLGATPLENAQLRGMVKSRSDDQYLIRPKGGKQA